MASNDNKKREDKLLESALVGGLRGAITAKKKHLASAPNEITLVGCRGFKARLCSTGGAHLFADIWGLATPSQLLGLQSKRPDHQAI